MRQNNNRWFYMGGSGLDRTDDFRKFSRSVLVGYNFFRWGLDSDWKIPQSTHLWLSVISKSNPVFLKLFCSVSPFILDRSLSTPKAWWSKHQVVCLKKILKSNWYRYMLYHGSHFSVMVVLGSVPLTLKY